MALTPCTYCAHGNPANAKFCNECGGTLSLAPCPHCGAVNEVGAKACYQCRKPLVIEEPASAATPSTAAAPDSTAPATSPPSRARASFMIAIALLAAVAVFGYLNWRSVTSTGTTAPASGSTATTGQAATTGAEPASGSQSPQLKSAATTDVSAPVEPPAHSPVTISRTPSLAPSANLPAAPPAGVTAIPPKSIVDQSVASRKTAPAEPVDARSFPAPAVGSQTERSPRPPTPCTREAAARGLCTSTPPQTK